MSILSDKLAQDFLENETQFQLGFLPTEQSSPLTRHLDQEFQRGSIYGVKNLQSVDQNVLGMCKRVFASEQYARLVECGLATVRQGGRVVFSGCGATGRLSILLECVWRRACATIPAAAQYADNAASIMTGGDYALVKSVESFEDYQEFGRQQVRELAMSEKDMLVAITEGGETSSVLGTVDEALRRNCTVFLMFNNPADVLAAHLERSRAAIENPRVTVLDLSCGPMALAGSTRMQATTSEQLVAGGALETILCTLIDAPIHDYATEFGKLLEELDVNAGVLADYIDFEAEVYKNHGLVTYFADDFLLDIFTDTTERSPTFMLRPFRKIDDTVSPKPWAFVKDPLYTTEEFWHEAMKRMPRCLKWRLEDYQRMNAPVSIQTNPPLVSPSELLKFPVGKDFCEDRCGGPYDSAVLITMPSISDKLLEAYGQCTSGFACCRHLHIGPEAQGNFPVVVNCADAPLRLMWHMAIKLVFNTISTGTMVVLGRVTGNWMSWVAVSNKKLIDRAIRLVAEIGNMDYPTACKKIFAAMEHITEYQQQHPGEPTPSAVQFALNS